MTTFVAIGTVWVKNVERQQPNCNCKEKYQE